MHAVTNEEYTPEIIRKVLEVLPELLAARSAGTLNLNLAPAQKGSIEDKIAIETCNNLMPRASRASNTVYQIDSVAAVLCDLERAIKACLDEQQNIRISRVYLQGYKMSEVAALEGVSVNAVSKSIERSIERMAKFLETPVTPKPRTYFGDQHTDTHRRKYSNATYIHEY